MIDFAALMKVLPIFILAVMSPGPDFMVVSATSLSHGHREGIKAAAGITTIICLYTFVSLMGLSALFERYLWLMIVIKICGGLYLLYLGWLLIKGSWTKSNNLLTDQKPVAVSQRNAYWAGVLTCLTNPKAIAFFASIFALALTPHTSMATKVAIELLIPLTAFLWFTIVAVSLARPAVRNRYVRWRPTIDRITGSVLAFFGIKLLFLAQD